MLKAAGIDGSVQFHNPRHAFATRMTAAGVPMRTSQERLGHRDVSTALVYVDYALRAREAEPVAHRSRGAR